MWIGPLGKIRSCERGNRLDSFLELKIENERLRQRLVDLRPSASSYPPPPYLSGASISNTRGGGADVIFAADSLNGVALNVNLGSIYSSGSLSLPRAYQSHYFAGPPLKMSNSSGGVALEEISPVTEQFAGNTSTYGSAAPSGAGRTRTRDADDVDGSHSESQPRRKKSRKLTAGTAAGSGGQSDDNVTSSTSGSKNTSAAPQYVCVTCGRTDSPEWRKGPLGAKTLCNACGLRWAKRNQKKKAETAANPAVDEEEGAAGPAKEPARQQDAEEATA